MVCSRFPTDLPTAAGLCVYMPARDPIMPSPLRLNANSQSCSHLGNALRSGLYHCVKIGTVRLFRSEHPRRISGPDSPKKLPNDVILSDFANVRGGYITYHRDSLSLRRGACNVSAGKCTGWDHR